MIQNPMNLAAGARTKEMAALVAEHERSDMTIGDFARMRGISRSTFDRWRRDVRRRATAAAQKRAPAAMLPVTIVSDTKRDATSQPFVLRLPSGLAIDVVLGFDAAELRRLVEALSC